MLIEVNGAGVVRGILALPRVGVWHAEIDVARSEPITGSVTLNVPGTELQLQGTVSTGRVAGGINRLRVVGGADGLRKPARPKHYVRPTVRLPLADLLRDAGEAGIASTTASSLLQRQLPAWTTIGVATGEQIVALVARTMPTGTAWRMLPEGRLWAGVETWPESKVRDWSLLQEHPRERRLTLGLTSPSLLPGTMLGGWRIDYVEHVIAADGGHVAHVWEAEA